MHAASHSIGESDVRIKALDTIALQLGEERALHRRVEARLNLRESEVHDRETAQQTLMAQLQMERQEFGDAQAGPP